MHYGKTIVLIWVLSWLLSWGRVTSAAQLVFDAAAGFSLVSNPNGPWRYGYIPLEIGVLRLYTHAERDVRTVGLDSWTDPGFGVDPHVIKNRTDSVLVYQTFSIPPGGLQLHPGGRNEFSVVRWTAPASGAYDIAAEFRGNDDTTTDVHLRANDTELFTAAVSAPGPGPSYQTFLLLQSGDTIDFVVGSGGNTYSHDSTGLAATITAVSGPPAWSHTSGGSWNNPANWSNGLVPGGKGVRVEFGQAITSNAMVTLSGSRTVGAMRFDNAKSYTIAGSFTLHLDNGNPAASISVDAGHHSIVADIAVAGALRVEVAANASLRLGDGLDVPVDRTLGKPGTGILQTAYIRGGSLAIDDGVGAIKSGGGFAGTSDVVALSITGMGQLDLEDHVLIVRGGDVTSIQALVASGRAGGLWNGSGINSSAAGADVNTGLAVVVNDFGLTSLGGRIVNFGDVLVKYSWNGDADLSGFVDGDDYFQIDSGFAHGLTGYRNGDFDYNGVVDGDDYFLIDRAFSSQTGLLGAAAVPEPVVALVLPVALVAVRRRNRAKIRK